MAETFAAALHCRQDLKEEGQRHKAAGTISRSSISQGLNSVPQGPSPRKPRVKSKSIRLPPGSWQKAASSCRGASANFLTVKQDQEDQPAPGGNRPAETKTAKVVQRGHRQEPCKARDGSALAQIHTPHTVHTCLLEAGRQGKGKGGRPPLGKGALCNLAINKDHTARVRERVGQAMLEDVDGDKFQHFCVTASPPEDLLVDLPSCSLKQVVANQGLNAKLALMSGIRTLCFSVAAHDILCIPWTFRLAVPVADAMASSTPADRSRAEQRKLRELVANRVIRPTTRSNRARLQEALDSWLRGSHATPSISCWLCHLVRRR